MHENKNLKPGWKILRFDQLAQQVNERIEPQPEDSELYVGLEHMDPGSLKIRRWGSPTDLIGTKFRMRKGDVLFARRNAYLKRVAIAPHDGLFSAHGIVLRPRPEAVVPDFLPYFMQSELFMDRAIEISVGSLSPTINWKTLAIQEFALPSIADQERLLQLFESSSSSIESLRSSLSAAQRLLKRLHVDYIDSASGGISLALDDALDRVIDYRGKSPNKSLSGVPLITARNVRDGLLDFSQPEFIPDADFDSWMTRGIPSVGDVLFTTEAPLGNVARVPNMRFALAQRLVCLRAKRGVMLGDYLFWLLRAPRTQQLVQQRATGSTVAGIKQSELRKIIVRVPPISYQRECVENLNAVEEACSSIEKRLMEAVRLQQIMMQEFL